MTDLQAPTSGTPAPPSAAEDPYCVRLGRVLQDLRAAGGDISPSPTHALGHVNVRNWETGCRKPSLATLAEIAALYDVPLLGILTAAHDPGRDPWEAPGGAHAALLTDALRTFDAAGGKFTGKDYRRRLGAALRALRHHGERTGREAPKLSMSAGAFANMECGQWRPAWRALRALCDAYGVGPLALLTHVLAPGETASADSLIACGETSILDPDDPAQAARLPIPDARAITAAVTAWSEAVGTGLPPAPRRRGAPSAPSRSPSQPPAVDAHGRALGQALRHFRTQAGLTLPEVAAGIGESVSTVRSCEHGSTRGMRAVVIACCEHYGVSPLALLVHLNDPASTALPASIGGADGPRIVAALAEWAGAAASGIGQGAQYRTRVADVLTALRVGRGVAGMDVCRTVRIHRQALVHLERGSRHPRLPALAALAAFYTGGLLSLLAHVTDPTWPIDKPIGGPDADRIIAALLVWDGDPPDKYQPPAPLQSQVPRVPLPGIATYTEVLHKVLRDARLAAGHSRTSPLGDLAGLASKAENGTIRPSLATVATLADAYGLSLLAILARALDPTVDPLHRPGGPHAALIARALLAWETGSSDPNYAARLGGILLALRDHAGIRRGSEALPIGRKQLRGYEQGATCPYGRNLVGLARTYGVGLPALLTHAANPRAQTSADALTACGETHILDPADPTGLTRMEVPDGPQIAAAFTAWATKSHGVESAVPSAPPPTTPH